MNDRPITRWLGKKRKFWRWQKAPAIENKIGAALLVRSKKFVLSFYLEHCVWWERIEVIAVEVNGGCLNWILYYALNLWL